MRHHANRAQTKAQCCVSPPKERFQFARGCSPDTLDTCPKTGTPRRVPCATQLGEGVPCQGNARAERHSKPDEPNSPSRDIDLTHKVDRKQLEAWNVGSEGKLSARLIGKHCQLSHSKNANRPRREGMDIPHNWCSLPRTPRILNRGQGAGRCRRLIIIPMRPREHEPCKILTGGGHVMRKNAPRDTNSVRVTGVRSCAAFSEIGVQC